MVLVRVSGMEYEAAGKEEQTLGVALVRDIFPEAWGPFLGSG